MNYTQTTFNLELIMPGDHFIMINNQFPIPNSSLSKTGFAAESGQIRKKGTFSSLRDLNLCTSHILIFGCLHDQHVVGS